jgi:ABC-type bacteriocin/lantibiotic exporter with double-glycine peptidase domain
MNYYKQETGYTCGPACCRMILSKFGIEETEQSLARLLETQHNEGTGYDQMFKLAEKYNLDVLQGQDDKDLDKLQKLVNEGWGVIIAYSLDVPHFSIFLEHNGNHLFLMDPFRGERVPEIVRKFKHRWKVHPEDFRLICLEFGLEFGDEKKSDGWWIAFRKKE